MFYRYFLGSIAAASLIGCAGTYKGVSATAELEPTAGNAVTGKVHFSQHEHGIVKVSGQVSGLKPNSEHGFHIHEKGDCSSPDGTSAGGHFNPATSAHGKHGQTASHVGDLPSLRANANGLAIVQFESTQLALGKGDHDILGKGLIVHANPDDFQTQPTGNAGARLACGVIERQ